MNTSSHGPSRTSRHGNVAVDKVFARLTANGQRHESRRVQVERDLDGVQQKLDRLIDALTDDSLPADEINFRSKLEKARKAALIAELKELRQLTGVSSIDIETQSRQTPAAGGS